MAALAHRSVGERDSTKIERLITERVASERIMTTLVGQTLEDRYLVTALLGRQRGRRTFLSTDIRSRSQVVLKLVLFGPDFTWEDFKLFEREAETLKSLNHAAIPKYLNFFEAETEIGKGFVLVQTYIEARSLQSQIESGRRFSEADIVEIALSLLTILEYLHSQHPAVVHRDIKPSNILLGDRAAHSPGKVYLIDFGSVQVVQHSSTLTVVGTYGYMPPEQFGGRASPASDLYSLGATLVYLASGQHPSEFEYGEIATIVRTLSLSESFSNWLIQLTQIAVSARPSSATLALQQLSLATSPTGRGKQITQSAATDSNSLPLLHRSMLNNLSVLANAEKTEIRLPSHRISAHAQKRLMPRLFMIWLALSPLWVVLLIYYSSIGIAWIVIWYTTVAFLVIRKSYQTTLATRGEVILNLWSLPDGTLRLSVHSPPVGSKHARYTSKLSPKKHAITKYQTVGSIETNLPAPRDSKEDRADQDGCVTFSLLADDRYKKGYLSIKATPTEISWLSDHLSQWEYLSTMVGSGS